MYVEITNKMATTGAEKLANGIDAMKVDDTNQNATSASESEDKIKDKYDMPVQDVYRIAVRFFKGI